jgi:hypothetical protein
MASFSEGLTIPFMSTPSTAQSPEHPSEDSRPAGQTPLVEALDRLLHSAEQHRLTFLYCATAKRRNATADSYFWETLDEGDQARARIPSGDIDAEGKFLFKYRWALERYAQAAIGQFGPSRGSKQTVFRNGQFAELEGGDLPVWSINEMDCSVLEQSSDDLLDACRRLARVDSSGCFHALVKKARSLAHDDGQTRWYACVLIRWDYLARLDALVDSLKSAEIDVLGQPAVPTEASSGGGDENAPSAVTPDQPSGTPPPMDPDQERMAGLGLLMLLSQTYYKILECTVSMASWCTALDLELNQSYLWTTRNLTNLFKNFESLRDFPVPFEPLFSDVYPSTIGNLEWQDMVAPEVERFLSAVQHYVSASGFVEPEKDTPAWVFIELFRPSVKTAVDRAENYAATMRQHVRKLMRTTPTGAPESHSTLGPPPSPSQPIDPPSETKTSDVEASAKPSARFMVDPSTLTVSMDGRSLRFGGRGNRLFALLMRISNRPGHRVSFDSLRGVGDVWNGYEVEDETIRGTVKRLRDKLRAAGLVVVADAIKSGTFQDRPYVILDLDPSQSASN